MSQVLKGAGSRPGASGNAPGMRPMTGQQQSLVGVGMKAGSPGTHPPLAGPGSLAPGPAAMGPTNPPMAGHVHILTPPQKGAPPPNPAALGGGTPIVGSGAMNGLPSVSLQPGSQQSIDQPAVAGAAAPDTSNESLANTKEKTPMCLINELARFNKIQHQYTLTDEQGPAHKKTFYVKLKLGEEEYSASGPSIKKAQHAAADCALEKTQYKHPPLKPPRNPSINISCNGNPSITPTVELNALAMKRGEPTMYRQLEPARTPYYPPNLDFRGMYNQRYHYPKYPRVFYVSLKVGAREFIGEGNTRQAARHNAADKALKTLSRLPLPADRQVQDGKDKPTEEVDGPPPADEESIDDLKSEISLVHEIALKRNLHVSFEVIKESGPPHMRNFVTRCVCGEHQTEAEGNSKKLSKKRAAEKMLEELQKLPPLPTATAKPKKPVNTKKKNRNLIKVVQDANMDYGVGINPISRLIQIQQAKKEKEPIYTLVAERGMPRRREFVIQVVVGDQMCTGVGPNKKLAKRNAAEAMLQQLGYSRPAPQPGKSSIKMGEGSPAADKKVTFLEQEQQQQQQDHQQHHHQQQHGGATRQVVPGVILMPSGDGVPSLSGPGGVNPYGIPGLSRAPGAAMPPMGGDMGVKYSPQTTAAIAKELLDTGTSPTAESIKTSPRVVQQSAVRPKQQLLYLAEVLGFQVQFTDFPKGSKKSEYLSLVSLSTNPPQVNHGAGPTLETSHDQAALTALRGLAEMGLEFVDVKQEDAMAAGDGSHIKPETIKSVDLTNA